MNNIIAIPRVNRREPIEVSTQNPAPPNTPIDMTSVVSVVLLTEQVVSLDEIAAQIRRRTGKTINRSGMIRTILSAVLPCHERWVKVTSEADLQQMVALLLTIAGLQAETFRTQDPAPPNTPIVITSVVSVVLLTEQVVSLDEIAAQIRRRTGKTISRSGIRAIVSAVLPCDEHWGKVTSEADLQQMVALRLTIAERQAESARRSSTA